MLFRVKLKESEKRDRYFDLAREQRNIKVTVISIETCALGKMPKGLVKGRENLEIRDHPNYSIIKIGQNTEKSPGDLRRLDVS